MRILFIEFTSDGTVGGSHTCLYNLVKQLNRAKYQASIAFYQTNPYVDKFNELGIPVYIVNRKPLTCGNVLVRKVRNWYRLVYNHRKNLTRLLLQNRIDLVVINNTIIYSDDIVKVCGKHNIPIISYERGYLDYNQRHIRASKKIYAAIAVSFAIKNNMLNHKLCSDTRVIYDGLALGEPSEPPIGKDGKDIKSDIGIPENSTVIGIVGNVRKWKGQEYFAKAFVMLAEKYPNLYGLVIGGFGKEDMAYVNHIKNIPGESEAGTRLRFLGFRDDVPDLLRIMDVFVHASITPEPFGMVILEAMYHHVPVIATNFGGPVEILHNGDFGILVPPRDAQAIAAGVERYLNDAEFRDGMVSKAHRRIIEDFDLRHTVRQVESLFSEAAGTADRA